MHISFPFLIWRKVSKFNLWNQSKTIYETKFYSYIMAAETWILLQHAWGVGRGEGSLNCVVTKGCTLTTRCMFCDLKCHQLHKKIILIKTPQSGTRASFQSLWQQAFFQLLQIVMDVIKETSCLVMFSWIFVDFIWWLGQTKSSCLFHFTLCMDDMLPCFC